MIKPTIEANICEIDGAHYQVKLHAIPRVGELIDLYSFLDQSTNHPPFKHYKVVQVVHKMYDVSEKIPKSMDGYHYVSVFVRPASSKFFE
jgi:hypothetical protein